jgi:clan AA aspartic protease
MGMVYADIELINSDDLGREVRKEIDQDEIRRMHVNVMVDSGAYMLAINENIQSYLNLRYLETRTIQVAHGRIVELDVVGPVDVRFGNRKATCNAFVLPGDCEPLLGAIPMEEMDVIIHPKRQELIINPEHPDGPVYRM